MIASSDERVTGVYAFERIGPELKLLPLAARRALDAAGIKVGLASWSTMPLTRRRQLVEHGAAEVIDRAAVLDLARDAAPQAIEAPDESRLDHADPRLAELLGPGRPMTDEIWRGLSKLARFALYHLTARGDADRLREAYDEIVGKPRLTHLSESGDARMVDVAAKPITHRRAVATARVRMMPETARLALDASGPKGDVIATARIAGIMAAKRTSELIPMCHPIALSRVAVQLEVDPERGAVEIKAAADALDRTGVEMEALTAASVAALTIYDMLKAVDRAMVIEDVALLEKSGGRSGHYRRDPGRENR